MVVQRACGAGGEVERSRELLGLGARAPSGDVHGGGRCHLAEPQCELREPARRDLVGQAMDPEGQFVGLLPDREAAERMHA
jgi:hypothetical protein